jgi:heat shock protein beta
MRVFCCDPSKYVFLRMAAHRQEYANEGKLKDLVQRYSEFINFPIYLETEKEVEVPVEEAEEAKEEDKEEEADEEDGEWAGRVQP